MIWKNARFNPYGNIDCDVLIGDEWFPFHAMPDDPEEYGRSLYYEILQVLSTIEEQVEEE